MTHWVYSRKKSLGVAEKGFLSPLLTSAGTREQFPTSAGTRTPETRVSRWLHEKPSAQWDTAPNGAIFSVFVEKVLDTRYPLG
jgi:hypothetical protein